MSRSMSKRANRSYHYCIHMKSNLTSLKKYKLMITNAITYYSHCYYCPSCDIIYNVQLKLSHLSLKVISDLSRCNLTGSKYMVLSGSASSITCRSSVSPLCQGERTKFDRFVVSQGERTEFDRFVDLNVRGAQRRVYWNLRIYCNWALTSI